MFAKPFLFALDGHMDGVYALNTLPTSLVRTVSGSGDGEVRVWNLTSQKCEWRAKAHTGIVRGLVSSPSGSLLLSASMDSTVKMWNMEAGLDDIAEGIRPVATFLGAHPFNGIDHHRKDEMFVTAGAKVELWNHNRSVARGRGEWKAETKAEIARHRACEPWGCAKFLLIELRVLIRSSPIVLAPLIVHLVLIPCIRSNGVPTRSTL